MEKRTKKGGDDKETIDDNEYVNILDNNILSGLVYTLVLCLRKSYLAKLQI